MIKRTYYHVDLANGFEFETDSNCCGILQMGGIDVYAKATSKNEYETLSEAAATLRYAIDAQHDARTGPGLVVCSTLDDDDFAASNKVLRRAGFKIVQRFRNPKTGNMVLVHHLALPSSTTKRK